MLGNNGTNPTFSSILLDEIDRSMVEDDMCVKLDKKNEGERDVMTLRKACLVEKWMEGKVRDKVTSLEKRKPQQFIVDLDVDSLLFTSSSSCSDNSSGGLFSDKDSKPLPLSCDLGKRPNPIRTLRSTKITPRQVEKPPMPEESVGKPKFRASAIYENLKKVKQPVSPGARLSSFINSLYQATKQAAMSRVRDDSVDSSPSSFRRSCIGNGMRAKAKLPKEVKRHVSILPRCGILKEHRNLPPREDVVKSGQKSGDRRGSSSARFSEETIATLSRRKCGGVSTSTTEEDDDSDTLSCESSDLFELRHIAYVGRCR